MRHPSRSLSAGWAWRACSQHGSLRAALPGSLPQWRCGSSMLPDLRFALRGFRRAPAFVATVALTPALGRTLLPEDATLPHGEPVLVLSYDAWRGKFGGDSGLVGRKIVVHGIPLTVVGVAAKRFTGIGRTLPPDFWAPVTLLSRLEG